jgi:putative transposase
MDQRIEFALKALRTDNFRALCVEYGISAKTGYKWRDRLLRWGVEGLAEQSRRPRSHPDQLSPEEICEMVRLKQLHPYWGPRKIRALYIRMHGNAASESSFKRMLARAGMIEPRARRRRAGEAGQLRTDRRAQGPNDIWTVDFKGWWYDTQRKRCEPLTVRDEYSRYILELRRLANARTETVRLCFEHLFERYGLPGAIRSDNGAPFAHAHALFGLSRLSVWWLALGIDLERGRPGHPQDNGAHERMHRDIGTELEPRTAEQEALDLWRQEFNHERPHEALGMRCPEEVYKRSAREYEGSPRDIAYPGMYTRRVNKHGMVKWEGAQIFITRSLRGWSVGLKPVAEAKTEAWFGRLFLGWIDRPTESFLRAASRPKEAGQTQSQPVW